MGFWSYWRSPDQLRNYYPRSLSRLIPYGLIFCLVIALIAIGANGCQSQAEIVSPLPQHPKIHVYFNQNQASRYTDPYRNIERLGDNFVTQIMFELRCF